jgi:hypothetical protein
MLKRGFNSVPEVLHKWFNYATDGLHLCSNYAPEVLYYAPEVVTEGIIVTYADDTTVYVMHKDREAVYTGLEKAGDKILLYMKSNALAANAEKTKFILFCRKKAVSELA